MLPNCFILSLICLIMASYMRHRWIWWRILDTDIVFSHQATSVWGWVLLAPVVVQGMVDSKVPLQSHPCNVQWTIFHRGDYILHYSAHTKFNISRWTFSFHTSIVRILIESAQFYESWLKVRGCNAFNFRSVWLKGTLCKRMHPMMVSLKINEMVLFRIYPLVIHLRQIS